MEGVTQRKFRHLEQLGGLLVWRYRAARRAGEDNTAESLRQQVGSVKWALSVLRVVRDRSTVEEWNAIMEAAAGREVTFRLPGRGTRRVEVGATRDDQTAA